MSPNISSTLRRTLPILVVIVLATVLAIEFDIVAGMVPSHASKLKSWTGFSIVLLTLVLVVAFYVQRTETEKTEMALQVFNAQELNRAVFDYCDDAITTWARDGRLLTINAASKKGFEEAGTTEFQNMTFHGLGWEGVVKDHAESAFAGALAGKTTRFVAEAGNSSIWWDLVTSPLFDVNGRPNGVLMIARNITLLKQTQNQAAQQEALRIASESANKAKSDFLAQMSHEVRNPLGIIIGFAELLRDENLNRQTRQRYVESVIRNGETVHALINDILDLSKVESGKLEIEHIPTRPADVAREVLNSFESQNFTKNLTLVLDDEDIQHKVLMTDPMRLKQILINLVSNAIKFTQQGQITIKLTQNAELSSDGFTLTTFEVSDTGMGISDEQRARLFQPFSQGDSSIQRRFKGSGIGLVLSRNLARRLGGDLVLADSVPGVGSTFVLTISSAPVMLKGSQNSLTLETEASQDNTYSSLKDVRVLLVDDSFENREVIRHLLEHSGASVEVAEDGQQAIERTAVQSFDVILMDIQMPVLDGFEATKQMRALGVRTPILAVSAHAMKEEQQQCFASGFSDFVSKPVSGEVLAEKINQLIGLGGSQTPETKLRYALARSRHEVETHAH